MAHSRPWLALAATFLLLRPPALAADGAGGMAEGAALIPLVERALPMVAATRPVVVPGAAQNLEGPIFDPAGDLVFSDVQGGGVLRLAVTAGSPPWPLCPG